MKSIRWVVGLGALAAGVSSVIVVACGGDEAVQCGAGTVLVNGVCQLAPTDGTTSDSPVSDDGSPPPDDGSPPPNDGSPPGDGGTDGPVVPPNRCPFGKGPVMAEIPNTTWDAGTFCIDTTEVSEAQYDQFLKDIGGDKGDAGPMPIQCDFNSNYTPGLGGSNQGPPYTYNPAKNATLPVRAVDWCDAYAYCRWAGKRLCGRYDKVTPNPGDAGSWRLYETNITCSQNDKTHKYPYGPTHQYGICPPETYYDASFPPVGTSACRGTVKPYSEVYDTAGSVGEWFAECMSNGDCLTGGAVSCDLTPTGDARLQIDSFNGVRCCAD